MRFFGKNDSLAASTRILLINFTPLSNVSDVGAFWLIRFSKAGKFMFSLMYCLKISFLVESYVYVSLSGSTDTDG